MVVCKPTDQLLGCLCLCCTWPPSKMLFLVFFCLALFLYGTSGDTVDTLPHPRIVLLGPANDTGNSEVGQLKKMVDGEWQE